MTYRSGKRRGKYLVVLHPNRITDLCKAEVLRRVTPHAKPFKQRSHRIYFTLRRVKGASGDKVPLASSRHAAFASGFEFYRGALAKVIGK